MIWMMIDGGGFHRLRQEAAVLASTGGIDTPRVSYNI